MQLTGSARHSLLVKHPLLGSKWDSSRALYKGSNDLFSQKSVAEGIKRVQDGIQCMQTAEPAAQGSLGDQIANAAKQAGELREGGGICHLDPGECCLCEPYWRDFLTRL